MTRTSTIKRLDPQLRELIDRLIREGTCTLDDIMEHLRSMGAEDLVSRSALGRYKKQSEEHMETYRMAQQMGQVWVDKLEADPKGHVGRLLVEMPFWELPPPRQAALMGVGANLAKSTSQFTNAMQNGALLGDVGAELTKTMVDQIAAMAAEVGVSYPLVWDDQTYTVRFRHSDAPAVEITPLRPNHPNLFVGSIKLQTI